MIDLMHIHGYERTVFDISAFCEAFLKTCAVKPSSGTARPEEGLTEGRNVKDSALVPIYLHEIYRN